MSRCPSLRPITTSIYKAYVEHAKFLSQWNEFFSPPMLALARLFDQDFRGHPMAFSIASGCNHARVTARGDFLWSLDKVHAVEKACLGHNATRSLYSPLKLQIPEPKVEKDPPTMSSLELATARISVELTVAFPAVPSVDVTRATGVTCSPSSGF